ncbi:stress-related protein-like [Aristolochia californica]|uniref:stress-related protein-like n=1 Tax=Aristolochia californica TaxID=171875 RepID=UPI0035D7625D
MAEADPKQQQQQQQQQAELTQEEVQRLKYLEFVQVAVIHAIVLFSNLYNFAKENSGPLKPGVQTVEGTVKTVIGPVYQKFHDVPLELLKFADNKVEGLVKEVDRHVPSLVKEVSCQAVSAAQKAPEVARSVAAEMQRAGVTETATDLAKTAYTRLSPKAKDLYTKYEPVAERYAVTAWRSFNRLPLFPEVAHIVMPTAAYGSEKYNDAVRYSADRGYRAALYMPLIPTERIAKVFGGENETVVSSTGVAAQ